MEPSIGRQGDQYLSRKDFTIPGDLGVMWCWKQPVFLLRGKGWPHLKPGPKVIISARQEDLTIVLGLTRNNMTDEHHIISMPPAPPTACHHGPGPHENFGIIRGLMTKSSYTTIR